MINTAGEKTSDGQKAKGLWRPLVLLLIVAALIILSRLFDLGQYFADVRDWLQPMGIWGPVIFVFIYAAATVAVLPGSIMSVIAGSLFGPVVGVITVSLGSTLGASLAFLIARYFARDAIGQWLSTKNKLRKLDDLIEEQGSIVVAFTRLVPIFPFVLLNYAFGLTRVRFRTYVFWTALCMIPWIIVFVVGAAAVFEGIAEGKVPWLLVGILAAVIVIVFLLTRYARTKIRANSDKVDAWDDK